ncbi:hypothetical protein ADUPG1_013207 [Aduncisulcus paluster]|uniref:Uncharacterized protein n=1 Tax=Aduncisulcus paluster TaxID=2918883 RepID=A0ABQ5K450_9EUKA|nr:hypothetical protein ADUPG1_013207 [Aduncisulcus paluster]
MQFLSLPGGFLKKKSPTIRKTNVETLREDDHKPRSSPVIKSLKSETDIKSYTTKISDLSATITKLETLHAEDERAQVSQATKCMELEAQIKDHINEISKLSMTITKLESIYSDEHQARISQATKCSKLEADIKVHLDKIAGLSSTVATLESRYAEEQQDRIAQAIKCSKLEDDVKSHLEKISTLTNANSKLEKLYTDEQQARISLTAKCSRLENDVSAYLDKISKLSKTVSEFQQIKDVKEQSRDSMLKQWRAEEEIRIASLKSGYENQLKILSKQLSHWQSELKHTMNNSSVKEQSLLFKCQQQEAQHSELLCSLFQCNPTTLKSIIKKHEDDLRHGRTVVPLSFEDPSKLKESLLYLQSKVSSLTKDLKNYMIVCTKKSNELQVIRGQMKAQDIEKNYWKAVGAREAEDSLIESHRAREEVIRGQMKAQDIEKNYWKAVGAREAEDSLIESHRAREEVRKVEEIASRETFEQTIKHQYARKEEEWHEKETEQQGEIEALTAKLDQISSELEEMKRSQKSYQRELRFRSEKEHRSAGYLSVLESQYESMFDVFKQQTMRLYSMSIELDQSLSRVTTRLDQCTSEEEEEVESVDVDDEMDAPGIYYAS